ncbi:hypothetical protein P7C71_g5677, partial [Lecanoromycetidae sp. Uapishka_2]
MSDIPMADVAPFLKVPAEIRLQIYKLLLSDHDDKTLYIRTEDPSVYAKRKGEERRRCKFRYISDRMRNRSSESTYCRKKEHEKEIHASILGVNRQIHDEAAHVLFSEHVFDFGMDIESILPFLQDLTPAALDPIKHLSITKRSLPYTKDFDRCEWRNACSFISKKLKLAQLDLVVYGGTPSLANRPALHWKQTHTFTESDFGTISKLKEMDDDMDWVKHTASPSLPSPSKAIQTPQTSFAMLQLMSHLFISFSLLLLTASAFPIKPQEPPALQRRAAYSVVAVDGGTAATSTADAAQPPPATTIIQSVDETITVTAPAITLPPSTDTIVATQVVTDSEPAQTVEVVVTHDITKTTSLPSKLKYVVVNDDTPAVESATTTTSTPLTSTSRSSSTPTTSIISTSSTMVSSTPTSTAVPTSTPAVSSTPRSSSITITTSTLPQISLPPFEAVVPEEKGWSPPAGLAPPPSLSTSATPSTSTTAWSTSTPTVTPTPKTYDDGMWHTNKPTGTKTYDDGMWHTTYPAWNASSTVLPSSSATTSQSSSAFAV